MHTMIYCMSHLPSGAENQQRCWIIYGTILILLSSKHRKYEYSLFQNNGRILHYLGTMLLTSNLVGIFVKTSKKAGLLSHERTFHCKAKDSVKTSVKRNHSTTAWGLNIPAHRTLRHASPEGAPRAAVWANCFISQVRRSFWKTFIWRMLKSRKTL